MRRCSIFSAWPQNERRCIFRRCCLYVFSDSSTVKKSIKKQTLRDPWMSEDLPWLRLLLFFPFIYFLTRHKPEEEVCVRTWSMSSKKSHSSQNTHIYTNMYTYINIWNMCIYKYVCVRAWSMSSKKSHSSNWPMRRCSMFSAWNCSE